MGTKGFTGGNRCQEATRNSMLEELAHMHHLPISYKMSLRCIAFYLISGSHPSQAGVPFIMVPIKKDRTVQVN